MRKIIATFAFLVAAVSASAQDVYSAADIASSNYYGTARSMAMGNAVTALGGDLGSIGINPAGGAVNTFSQFAISLGGVRTVGDSKYAVVSEFGPSSRDSESKFVMPNIGLNSYYSTGNKYGIKGYSIGLVANTVDQYLGTMLAGGTNPETSMLSSMADFADGNYYKDLYNGVGDMNSVVAYRSGMISTYSTDYNYWSVTDAEFVDPNTGDVFIALSAPVAQRTAYSTWGSKTDLAVNLAFNCNDRYFFGFNLGLPNGRYCYEESFVESAVDPKEFPLDITNFDYATYGYYMSRQMSGIYGKFGLIAMPIDGLRFGIAFQTPTLYNLKEYYRVSGETFYTNNQSDRSTLDSSYEYSIISPYKLNLGFAYTFKRGLISVDYELSDFGTSRYKRTFDDDYTDFRVVNRINRVFLGVEHDLRVGGEFRVTPMLSVRAGFTMNGSPYFTYRDNNRNVVTPAVYNVYFNDFENGKKQLFDKQRTSSTRYSYSAGLGYNSGKSFFADLCVRDTVYPTMLFSPYGDYCEVASPTVSTRRKLLDVVVTMGWRF